MRKRLEPRVRRRSRERTGIPAQPASSDFLKFFWVFVLILVAYSLLTYSERRPSSTFAALFIAAAALLPSYLWCSDRVRGLPIFPMFCAAFVVTHAIQLLIGQERLEDNPPEAIWMAAFTVAGTMLVGTVIWRICLGFPRSLPPTFFLLGGSRGTTVLFFVLAASTFFTVAGSAGWLSQLPSGIFSIVRGLIRGLTGFTTFVLAMRWGSRELSPSLIVQFFLLMICFLVADVVSLYLISTISTCLMLLVGFAIGRKAVPWLAVAAVILAVSILHVGKGDMRQKYWSEEQGHVVSPLSYPSFFMEWAGYSAKVLSHQRGGGEWTASIFERANTIDLMLQAQRMAPDEVPFLDGATYRIIPDALIPRIFSPTKRSPHESTTMLNVYFGNQTQESAESTSIGWGLLNEAYANFGIPGCLALGAILGAFYGWMTRWSVGHPLTSVSTLVGIFTMAFAMQTEMTAAVYITAYIQGLFGLLLLAFFFARRQARLPLPPGEVTAPKASHASAS